MKPFTRIISIITLTCFTLANISLAQDANSFKLSPPSSFSNLRGQEFKETAQIQAGILSAVKDLQALDADSIKALGQKRFIEKTVFGKRIEGNIYFNEASECRIEGRQVQIEKGSYVFRAVTNNNKIYYALISGKREQAGYEISVISERAFADALNGGIVKFTDESVDKKYKAVIDLYPDHEVTTENNTAVNDYAAGYATKKSIFARVMASVIAVIVGGQISGFGTEPQISVAQPTAPFEIAASIGAPKQNINAAAQPYSFAHKYTVEGVARNQKEAENFLREYFRWESGFYKSIRINGIAMDGFNLKQETLAPAQIRDWTAASKECLDLAVQLKILAGNRYGIQLAGHNDADAARQAAIRILKEKMGVYEGYSRSFPAFGGFLPWTTIRDGKIQPTSDWSDRLPALDNGEWVWSLYTAYHALKNAGENDLAARYKKYFEVLVKNAPSIFYDKKLRKIRAEAKIRNPKAGSVDVSNYSNNIAGYYLDDSYEGMMMVSFLTLFTDLPRMEKDHIWNDIKMEKVTTKYGTTYKAWPPQSPLDGSPHIKWAFMFLPFTDNPIAMKVYLLQEKIRTNMHKYGIPVSTNTPGAIGYTAYEPNVFGLYGPFSMIFGQTLRGDVTQNNYGLAWFLNVLRADKMQGPLGSGESLSVKPGTNQLDEVSTVVTVDGKMILWLAMMGGIQNETREALKADGLYDKFMAPVNRLYAATFGDVGSVQDNAQFLLPQKPIVGQYTPTVHKQTAEVMDLSVFWQYPALDKWGDKTAVRMDGNKMIIEYKPGSEGGWGWAGGSLRSPLTPGKGSAIYFKGKGEFTLKLECKDKEAVYIKVNLAGLDKWTKVPLDTAVGKTFFLIAIDNVWGNIVIADRFYSPDGKVPDKSALPAHPPITTPSRESKKEEIKRIEEEAGKIPVEEVKRRAKAEDDAIKEAQIKQETERAAETKKSKITAKQGKIDLMSIYNLSPGSNWGPALVSKQGKTLTVKHNVKENGYGWSWAGENLRGSYILKENEGIRIEGKGKFTLKLEGSEIVLRPVDLDKTGVVIINDLPKDLKILRIVIDKVMYGTTVEIESMEIINTKEQSSGGSIKHTDQIAEILWGAGLGHITKIEAEEKLAKLLPETKLTQTERNTLFDIWLAQASLAMAAMAVKSAKYSKPSDEDIRLIATRIKEAGVEVFIPKTQFPGDTIGKYRGIIGAIGGGLRVYQHIEDLQAMIKNPAKSIVMTNDLTDAEAPLLQSLKAQAAELRFMNFAKMDGLDKMTVDEIDNYEAEILSILLIARVITPEDFQDKGSPAYRMLSNLLEDYMPEGITVEDYIQDIVANAARLIKTILKALPVTAYKVMKQAVEVLWSA